jgi:hypothetical protein
MKPSVGALLQELRPAINRVNSRETLPVDVLSAMWEIGDILRKNRVSKPHSVGDELQHATGGIVKRPVIFQSAKVRDIWPSSASLRQELWGLRSKQNVIDMLPFLDPKQRDRYHVTKKELAELRLAMVGLQHGRFDPMLRRFKRAHAVRSLGKKLDREQHLPELAGVASQLSAEGEGLQRLLEEGTSTEDLVAAKTLAARLRFSAGGASSLDRAVPELTLEPLIAIDRALSGSGVLTNVMKRRRLWRLFARERLMELADAVLATTSPEARSAYFQHQRMAETLSPQELA